MLSRKGEITANLLFYAAVTHTYLGHYQEAMQALERALHIDDSRLRAARSYSWLLLGNLNDLLGERKNAEQAYQRAMTEPEPCHPNELLG
jgi:tetratricopeptide (TPR) repeat protein